MFFNLDAGGKAFFRIFVQNGNCRLYDDGAGVSAGVYEMNSAARYPRTMFERLPLGV